MWNELNTWIQDKGIDMFPISLSILVIYFIYSYVKIKNKRVTQSQVLCMSCKYKKLDSIDDINVCHEYKKSCVFSFKPHSYCPIDMNKIKKIDKDMQH